MEKRKSWQRILVTAIAISLLTTLFQFPVSAGGDNGEALGFPDGWSDDIQISSTNQSYEERSRSPTIASWDNHTHMIWMTSRSLVPGPGIEMKIEYSRSTDSGNAWTQPVALTPYDGYGRLAPKLVAVNQTHLHLVWDDGRFTRREVMYRNSTDGGVTWSDEALISPADSEYSQNPSVAASGQNVHVVWEDSRNDDIYNIYYKRSTDGGTTWDDGQGNIGQDRRLTFSAWPSADVAPFIAVHGDYVHLIYTWWSDLGFWETMYMRSADNGGTWTAPVMLSEHDFWHSDGFGIALNESGGVHVVFAETKYGNSEIGYRCSTDNGDSWLPEVRLSYDPNKSHQPYIAVNDIHVFVAWMDDRDHYDYAGAHELYCVESFDSGASWGPETRLTYAVNSSFGPAVAMDADRIHVVWGDNISNGSRYEVFYKRYPDFPDTGPPEIHHAQVASANVFDAINITAAITDDKGVDAVFLNYTGVNGTNYNVSMQKWNGNWSYDIPGQDSLGYVEYFIWANDTSGNANMTGIFQVPIEDITAPEINHTPESPAYVFDVINVTAIVTDDVAVEKVFLDYTGVNGTNYNVSMNRWGDNFSYDIPGQGNTGFVNYFIWANDTSGNSNRTVTYQIQIFDITGPEINHVPVMSANVSEIINITANVTDDVGVGSVYLNYTDVHGNGYNVSMQKWNGNYTYEIPGQGNTGFVEYFIWANDTSGNSNRTVPHQIQIFDITEPKIYHVPVMSANVSEIINITANVTDDVGVGSVYLNYTDVHGNNYNVSMQKWNGNYSYEIPGQDTIGNARYFIWANDTSGNTNQTAIYQVQINDVTKPEIIHSPVTSANANEAINITAEISDDVGVDSVYLNYTDVHGNKFNVTMQKWNGKYSYDIPGQGNTGIVEYFIWANDTSGNAKMTEKYTVQIIDITAPVIVHTPPASAPLGTPISITANVTDDVGVANVTLHYQNVGDTAYTTVDMAFVSDDWIYEIPAQDKTGTVHYFIWANDTSGNNATSPTMGDYSIRITGPPSIVITNPKGGEIFTGGSIYQIEFTATDTEDSADELTVFLNYTSGAEIVYITQIKGNESSYPWTLPKINATDVRMNATVVDSDGNKAYAESPMFTIDSALPRIVSTTPANNTTGIYVGQPIVIQFSEPMNVSSVQVNQTNSTDPGGWQWFWNETSNTLTGIHNTWARGEAVEITVHAGYMDASEPGNANDTAYVFSFTTEINPSPEIVHVNVSGPQELGDAIRINATITDDGTVMNAVLWWRDVDGNWHESYMQKDGVDWSYVLPGQMTEGSVRYQINATDDLGQRNSTAIYEFDIRDTTPPVIAHTPILSAVVGMPVNITCLVTDLGGVGAVYLHYRNESEANFTRVMMKPGYWYELAARSLPVTIEYYIMAIDQYGNEASTGIYSLAIIDPTVLDSTPPEVLFVGPTGAGVPVTTTISIVFSEAVNQASVEGVITISPAVSGITYTWLNDQTLTVSFNALQFNTTYTVTIGTGATNLAGNALASAYSWQFITGMEPEIVEPPAPNNWGWIGIIIFLIVIIVLMLLYLFNKEKKEPDNTKKE